MKCLLGWCLDPLLPLNSHLLLKTPSASNNRKGVAPAVVNIFGGEKGRLLPGQRGRNLHKRTNSKLTQVKKANQEKSIPELKIALVVIDTKEGKGRDHVPNGFK